jgi:hypothetical protein
MLPHPTTPRLLSITLFSATYCTDFPKYYSVPSCYTGALADYSTETVEYYTEAETTTLPRTTQPQLRRPSITQSRLTTQKLLFRTTLNQNTTLILQFTTPRPTLLRSPQVLHRRSRLLHNNVCCLVYYTEAPKYYITKAPEFYASMYDYVAPAYHTEAPHYYNTEALKYYTTTYAALSYYNYVTKYYCA